jgi:hypothetical protein
MIGVTKIDRRLDITDWLLRALDKKPGVEAGLFVLLSQLAAALADAEHFINTLALLCTLRSSDNLVLDSL